MSKAADSIEKLRDLPSDELKGGLARIRDELFRLQLGSHTNQVTSTAAMMAKRREVARILTVLRARELGTETQGQGKRKSKKEAKS
jgi:large subunit ribosomal protein L29